MSERFEKDYNIDGHPIKDNKTGLYYVNFDKNPLVKLLNELSEMAERATRLSRTADPEVMKEPEFNTSTSKRSSGDR